MPCAPQPRCLQPPVLHRLSPNTHPAPRHCFLQQQPLRVQTLFQINYILGTECCWAVWVLQRAEPRGCHVLMGLGRAGLVLPGTGGVPPWHRGSCPGTGGPTRAGSMQSPGQEPAVLSPRCWQWTCQQSQPGLQTVTTSSGGGGKCPPPSPCTLSQAGMQSQGPQQGWVSASSSSSSPRTVSQPSPSPGTSWPPATGVGPGEHLENIWILLALAARGTSLGRSYFYKVVGEGAGEGAAGPPHPMGLGRCRERGQDAAQPCGEQPASPGSTRRPENPAGKHPPRPRREGAGSGPSGAGKDPANFSGASGEGIGLGRQPRPDPPPAPVPLLSAAAAAPACRTPFGMQGSPPPATLGSR